MIPSGQTTFIYMKYSRVHKVFVVHFESYKNVMNENALFQPCFYDNA